MTILLDTGFFLGFLNGRDPHHADAVAHWRAVQTGKHGRIFSLDAVYVEAMNYLARKPPQREVAEGLRQLREGGSTSIRWLGHDDQGLAIASGLYFDRFDRGLSMTDCLLISAAKQMGAKVVTFDRGFHGLVPLA